MKPRFLVLIFAMLFAFAVDARAVIANAWHIPARTQTGIPATMRDPRAVLRASRGTSDVSLCSDRLGCPGVFREGAEHCTRGARAPQMHAVLLFRPGIFTRSFFFIASRASRPSQSFFLKHE